MIAFIEPRMGLWVGSEQRADLFGAGPPEREARVPMHLDVSGICEKDVSTHGLIDLSQVAVQ